MNLKHGYAKRGSSRSPEYRSWRAMKTRCLNPKASNYPMYGGRGISIYGPWIESFEIFLEDVGPRPVGTSLGRIDNDKGYYPNNVEWQPVNVQQSNRSDNILVTVDNRTQTIAEWARELRMSRTSFKKRISNWPKERWLESRDERKVH